ncbi:membrane-spanning 4-domains subfamily A member 4D-like [Brachionichthys hirsutus]|uniref:membrane-spanning 4-domains subfamily A member 4D-like n=1 Tax=Brachionichthys hirsutus TaxID=412623 RepID=UPI0036050B1E
MSLTMAKADGVTVFTLTSDPQSSCPPICQIFKGLCYSPACCSVSRHLKSVQGTSQSTLGALHMMVGLINIGLGAILCSSGGGSWYQMDRNLFPFWFGGVFLFLGVMSILSEKCPSPCLVLLNVTLSLAGVALAIASIVLYSINIAHIHFSWICSYGYYSTPPPLFQQNIRERCLEARSIILMMMRSINAVLIVVSVLEFCVSFSAGYYGIKALRSSKKGGNKTHDDPEHRRAPLEEATRNLETA